jgi:hypothetical protein
MNTKQLIKCSPEKLFRKYAWDYDKKEWLKIVINSYMSLVKFLVVIMIILQPFISAGVLADGVNSNYYVAENIKMLATTLPAMEKAFQDVDSLRKSISKVAYQDPDRSFIFAFLITKWALANHHDPLEVAAVILTESEFKINAVSPKDARGLMQIHKPSWKMDNYFDAEENIKKGSEILLMYKRGFPQQYLAKYSGGEEGYAKKVENNKAKIKKEKLKQS